MKTTCIVSLVAALLVVACVKEPESIASNQNEVNQVVVIPTEGKTSDATYLMMNIGHDGRTCNGCIFFGGKYIHQDCMGRGNYCRPIVRVNFDITGTDIFATTLDTFDLTSEDFFLMPNRSLSYTDENNNRIFLNIPAQLVYRDTATKQFTFTGLFFSETAEYTNN